MIKPAIRTAGIFAVLLLTAACLSQRDSNSLESSMAINYIDEVDHIVLKPDNAEEFHYLLTSLFELSQAWPFDNYGGVIHAGVHAGNVNLSIVMTQGTRPGITGFAFDPSVGSQEVKEGLEARGLDCGELDITYGYWTQLYLGKIHDIEDLSFLEYHFDFGSETNYGNPLTIQGVSEITMTTENYEEALEKWGRLFAPVQPSSPGFWELGEGPAIRIVEGEQSEIESMQFKVESLETAEGFLQDNGLMGHHGEGSIFTDPEATNQILIEFKE